MNDFEQKVLLGLQKNGVDFGIIEKSICNFKIGVAVSGGADSVSLLISLVNIFSPLEICVHAITVNHFIRPEEDTCGDVDYVKSLCENLKNKGFLVDLSVVELKKGQVSAFAEVKGGGIEDAARALRYEAFERFICDKNLDVLCLAHNLNDNYETLLMRFLKGSSCDGLRGILSERTVSGENKGENEPGNKFEQKYIRPLLGISRSEIEAYLNEKSVAWRTDATNSDVSYLRNKIRLELIPFLDEHFANWRAGLEAGMVRANDDYEIIQQQEQIAWKLVQDDNSIDVNEFKSLSQPMQKRVLLRMCNRISDVERISYWFLSDVCAALKTSEKFTKVYENIEICAKKKRLFVKKYVKIQTDLCFSDIIYKKEVYHFPFGNLLIEEKNKGLKFVFTSSLQSKKVIFEAENLSFPVCIRNCRIGDEVICADGSIKKLSDVYSDWQVCESDRKLIPLIQELNSSEQKIVCVAAGILGYKNWILKEYGETK